MQDTLGLRPHKPAEALPRHLARSYTALASVLLALRSEAAPAAAAVSHWQPADAPHVPWRDSALTKWLRPVLTPTHSLTILATVDPSPDAAQDTLATLTYVSRFRTPRPGVRISAPLAGHTQSDGPARPGSTQPPGGRRDAATAAVRQARSASTTPRVSTPPAGGPSGHPGPCYTSHAHWQSSDLTPRSQPLALAHGGLSALRGTRSPQPHGHQSVEFWDDRRFAADAVGRSRSPQTRWPSAQPATADRFPGLGEPISPGTEAGDSPRRPPQGSLARVRGQTTACAHARGGGRSQGSQPQQCGSRCSAPDGRGLELLALLRRRGVGVREEALLEQLMQEFGKARDEVSCLSWLPGAAVRPSCDHHAA